MAIAARMGSEIEDQLVSFRPDWACGVSLAVTATTGSVALSTSSKGNSVEISNVGANIAYIRLGAVGSSATTAGYAIPPYQSRTITRDQTTETYLHAICDTALTTTLKAITGYGRGA